MSILLVLLYLHTSVGLNDTNASILHTVFSMVANFPGQALIGGDFQMTPQELCGCPWINFLGLKFLVPNNVQATCSVGEGRMIDFFVATPQFAPFVSIWADTAVDWVPHVGLRLSFSSRLRSHWEPAVKVPKPLPIVPRNDDEVLAATRSDEAMQKAAAYVPGYIEKWSNGTGIIGANKDLISKMDPCQVKMSQCLCEAATTAEVYTCYLADVNESEFRRYIGRGALPHVSLKPICKRSPISDSFRSSSASFWGKIEVMLNWCLIDHDKLPKISRVYQPIADLKKLSYDIQKHWYRKAATSRNCRKTISSCHRA